MRMTINLLPWREMARETRRRHFFIKWTVSFVVVLLVTLIGRQVQYAKLDVQKQRNTILKNEIYLLDSSLNEFSEKEIKRDVLERRLELVNALQKQRNNSTLLFNLLPHVMPEGVVLDKVSMNEGKVQLEGRSRSNAQLAQFLARLEEDKAARDVQIHSIVNTAEASIMMEKKFRTTFELAGYVVPKLPKETKNVR